MRQLWEECGAQHQPPALAAQVLAAGGVREEQQRQCQPRRRVWKRRAAGRCGVCCSQQRGCSACRHRRRLVVAQQQLAGGCEQQRRCIGWTQATAAALAGVARFSLGRLDETPSRRARHLKQLSLRRRGRVAVRSGARSGAPGPHSAARERKARRVAAAAAPAAGFDRHGREAHAAEVCACVAARLVRAQSNAELRETQRTRRRAHQARGGVGRRARVRHLAARGRAEAPAGRGAARAGMR